MRYKEWRIYIFFSFLSETRKFDEEQLAIIGLSVGGHLQKYRGGLQFDKRRKARLIYNGWHISENKTHVRFVNVSHDRSGV